MIQILLKNVVVLFLILLTTSCKLPNQNPKDSFWDGKLPRFLQKMADEYWQVKRHEKEIEKLILRNSKQDRMRIAVIDNGLDVLHPEILRNVAWRKNSKGEIVAGFDPLGRTNIANASFINPELYAIKSNYVLC